MSSTRKLINIGSGIFLLCLLACLAFFVFACLLCGIPLTNFLPAALGFMCLTVTVGSFVWSWKLIHSSSPKKLGTFALGFFIAPLSLLIVCAIVGEMTGIDISENSEKLAAAEISKKILVEITFISAFFLMLGTPLSIVMGVIALVRTFTSCAKSPAP